MILIELVDVIARKTIATAEMIHITAMNAVNALLVCPNPKSVFAVQEQPSNLQGTAIQFGRDKWLPDTFRQLLQSQTAANVSDSYP